MKLTIMREIAKYLSFLNRGIYFFSDLKELSSRDFTDSLTFFDIFFAVFLILCILMDLRELLRKVVLYG